jgi:hypothetical protein
MLNMANELEHKKGLICELVKHNPIGHALLKYLWNSSLIAEIKQPDYLNHGGFVKHNQVGHASLTPPPHL